MVDFLVSRGHRYRDVVETYPLSLVTTIFQAAQHNYRSEVVSLASAVSIGVSAALDASFGGGRANVMKKFTETMLADPTEKLDSGKSISPETAAFLGSLPVKKVRHG